MQDIETEVLVVGAGLTGATAALLLARHGVQTHMISRGRWVADSPRAHIINQRTMEVMRAVGLEQACAETATPRELMANQVMMHAMAGPEFGRLWTWGNDPARLGEYATASPCSYCDLPQDRFEPILVGEAMRRGVVARFDTRFHTLEQDEDGVTAIVEDLPSGESIRIRARYVIGADGGQSTVARAIGLPLTGDSGIAPALNVSFRADLSRHVAHRPGSLYWIMQPNRRGSVGNAMVRMVRPWDRWVAQFVVLSESLSDLDERQLGDRVGELIGDESVDVEITGAYPWRINHVIADRYSDGRVHCAGDAVHRHPPMNGLGGNTCIQDAFNLAWKLAAVLRWGATPRLLDSYNAERQPIGRRVVDRAIKSWRENPDLMRALGIDPRATPSERQGQFDQLYAESDAGERRREAFDAARRAKAYGFELHGLEMNQVYASEAVIDTDEPSLQFTRDPELHYQVSSRPGARLPHCWVEYRGVTCSTLDLAAPEAFTLLTRIRGRAWLDAAEQIKGGLRFALAVLRIGPGCEVSDLYGAWPGLSEIGEDGCLLVRPDQHIAWRCRKAPDQPIAALHHALTQCVALDLATTATTTET